MNHNQRKEHEQNVAQYKIGIKLLAISNLGDDSFMIRMGQKTRLKR